MSEDLRRERRVRHVGTYRRELPVSLVRLYENAIDWEHLPYLHRGSFARIECADAGAWGFRARVWPQPYTEQRSFDLELRLDRELRRWITSTLDGPGSGTEVWTHAFSLAERRTLVVVDFFVPGIDAGRRTKVGRFYHNLYARLYDEDVQMMSERQAQLDFGTRRAADTGRLMLGLLHDVRARLPMTVECGGRRFCIAESEGVLRAFSAICPHRLGPLSGSQVVGGVVECRWHGYRYDIRTRQCVSGAKLCLAIAPRVRVDAQSRVVLELEPEQR